jgi:hypothetical protein
MLAQNNQASERGMKGCFYTRRLRKALFLFKHSFSPPFRVSFFVDDPNIFSRSSSTRHSDPNVAEPWSCNFVTSSKDVFVSYCDIAGARNVRSNDLERYDRLCFPGLWDSGPLVYALIFLKRYRKCRTIQVQSASISPRRGPGLLGAT